MFIHTVSNPNVLVIVLGTRPDTLIGNATSGPASGIDPPLAI